MVTKTISTVFASMTLLIFSVFFLSACNIDNAYYSKGKVVSGKTVTYGDRRVVTGRTVYYAPQYSQYRHNAYPRTRVSYYRTSYRPYDYYHHNRYYRASPYRSFYRNHHPSAYFHRSH